jgi:thiamine biosynthesis lipoprotein
MRVKYLIYTAFFSALLLPACSGTEASRSEFVLGTVCTVTLYDQGKDQVYRNIFSRLREIENLMSVNLVESDVSRINAAAALEPVRVHKEVFTVIERSLRYAALSSGMFDPTVEPLVSLWNFGGDRPRLPKQEEIDAARDLINWQDVVLDREQGSVFLKRPGMALDLGAIAKGYAADEAAAIIGRAGIKRAIIDLGGNILVYGLKKDKSPWKIGIQDPSGIRGSYIGFLRVQDKTVVTSGVYERYFEVEGRRYHHILSTQTGYPVQNGLLSVSIVTGRSIDADALSTAVFTMGYEKGKALLESLADTQGIFIFEDRGIRICGEIDFTLSNDNYRIIGEGKEN